MLRPHTLLLLLLIVFAQFTYAETSDEGCLQYTIVFGNGVGNSEDDALDNLEILTGLIGSRYNNKDVNYTIAYNPTEGPGALTLLDVVEVVKQKAGENNSLWSLTWKVIFGVVDKAEPNQSWVDTIVQVWIDFNTSIIGGMRYNLVEQSSYYDGAVASHVDLYKTLLTNQSDQRRVLVVAHSQGNLYANIALQKLEQDLLSLTDGSKYLSRFGMVGVGSAADFVYKNGPYMTSTYDNVINALRATYPTVLIGNVTLPAFAEHTTIDSNGESVTVTDYSGHGFATVYANSAYSGRALLKSHIEQQLNTLKDDESADDDSTYTWYLATEKKNGGSISPDLIESEYSNYGMVGSMACYGENTQECRDAWEIEFQQVYSTEIILFGYWQQAPGDGRGAVEQLVFPRIFDPSDPVYIGFARNEARIKYREIDGRSSIWIQYPKTELGLDYQLMLRKEVYTGVKACSVSS